MKRRRALAVFGTVAIATSLSLFSGALVAFAGSNGQHLSLRDVNGNIYSAYVDGDNQNCTYVEFGIGDWANHDYDIQSWWWQQWTGCNDGDVPVSVDAFSGTNFSGNNFATFYLSGPPHSQTSDWWTCEVDGASACTSGQDAYG